MNLSLKFREQMVGPLWAVGEEFDQLLAALNARIPLAADGTFALGGAGTTISKFKDLEVTDSSLLSTKIQLNGQTEFLKGPWMFDQPDVHVAILRPPTVGGSYNDYNTTGLDTAIGMVISPGSATTFTGLANPTRRARLLFLRNRDTVFSVTLKDNSSSSTAGYRFSLPSATSGSGSAAGDVTGPSSAVANDVAAFSGTTGKIILDSGILYTDVMYNTGGSVTSGHILVFSGTGGRAVTTSGIGMASISTTTQITLTESQLESLGTTPIQVVAAQGANTIVQIVRWAIELTVTTGYTSSPSLSLQYNDTDTTGANMATISPTWTASSVTRYMISGPSSPSQITYSATTDPRNKAVMIAASGNPGTPATGVATAKVIATWVVFNVA